MEQQATQSSEKKESGLGWGTVFAGIAVIGTVVGAVTGLSHLHDQPVLQVPQGNIDSISEMTRGLDTEQQLREKAQAVADGAAGKIDETLRSINDLKKGGGEGLTELSKTALGAGEVSDARKAIAETFKQLTPDAIKADGAIEKFAAGDAPTMRHGDGWLLKDSADRVFTVSDEGLKKLDPRLLGGILPSDKQLIEGMNPNAVSGLQGAAAEAAKAKSEAEQMLLKKAISGGTIASVVGLGLKAAEKNHEKKTSAQGNANLQNNAIISSNTNVSNNMVPFHPSTRIDSKGTQLLGLAASAKEVNRAFASIS